MAGNVMTVRAGFCSRKRNLALTKNGIQGELSVWRSEKRVLHISWRDVVNNVVLKEGQFVGDGCCSQIRQQSSDRILFMHMEMSKESFYWYLQNDEDNIDDIIARINEILFDIPAVVDATTNERTTSAQASAVSEDLPTPSLSAIHTAPQPFLSSSAPHAVYRSSSAPHPVYRSSLEECHKSLDRFIKLKSIVEKTVESGAEEQDSMEVYLKKYNAAFEKRLENLSGKQLCAYMRFSCSKEDSEIEEKHSRSGASGSSAMDPAAGIPEESQNEDMEQDLDIVAMLQTVPMDVWIKLWLNRGVQDAMARHVVDGNFLPANENDIRNLNPCEFEKTARCFQLALESRTLRPAVYELGLGLGAIDAAGIGNIRDFIDALLLLRTTEQMQ